MPLVLISLYPLLCFTTLTEYFVELCKSIIDVTCVNEYGIITVDDNCKNDLINHVRDFIKK
jgi:hypothetical protein